MKWMVFQAMILHLSGYTGPGTTWVNEWILLWIMPLVQDWLLGLLTCSPTQCHCTTYAPPPHMSTIHSPITHNIQNHSNYDFIGKIVFFTYLIIAIKVMVKVRVYSPDIPIGTADFTLITPKYLNSLFHSLISLWRTQNIFCSHSHSTNFHSNWYPLLLGGQR